MYKQKILDSETKWIDTEMSIDIEKYLIFSK